jgi:RHS repeat-associated protein
MDNLIYNYNKDANGKLINNKLNYVNDWATPNAGYAGDMRQQSANNYTYDAIGNLTADVQAGVSGITWSVYGKITSQVSGANTISYTYDVTGKRVTKTSGGITTYYVRDGQGNTLAVYDNKLSQTNWREQHLYGSSRIGMWTPNVNLANNNATTVWDTAGHKQYELTNHLGNVMATLTDKRIAHSSDGGATVDYYLPDITTAQEYYSFGSLMPGLTYAASNNYRYGFNGKENDNDVKGTGNEQDYGMRIYDTRIGRFLSVDPITSKYPELTPYQFASNRPIDGIDLDGMEYVPYVPKYEYTGGLIDYVKAIDNGVINVINIIPSTWNSGVVSYQALSRGTYLHDFGAEIKQDGLDVKDWAVGNYQYTVKTPFLTQLKDAGKTLIAPQSVETYVTFYVGSKIPIGGGKGNLLKANTAATSEILEESGESLASKYAKTRPKFRNGVIEKVWKKALKEGNGIVTDPNTGDVLTWDKTKPRRGQWDMGHIKGNTYNKLVEDLKTGKINQQQFLDEYNNPDNYTPEDPSSNRSRRHN